MANKNGRVTIARLQEQMKENFRDHKEIKQLVCDVKKDLKEFINSADQRYASKWTEKAIWIFIGGAIGLIYYILQKII